MQYGDGNFSAPSFDDQIGGQNWVSRALDLVEYYPLDRPLPSQYQSGRPTDFDVYLPSATGGEIAAGDMFIASAVALEAQFARPSDFPAQADVVRSINPQEHTTYSVDVPGDGKPVTIYSFNQNRSYSLVVASGANQVWIAYGRDADTNGLNLPGAGVGFHELVSGTVGSLSVVAAVGAASRVTITEGKYYPSVF